MRINHTENSAVANSEASGARRTEKTGHAAHAKKGEKVSSAEKGNESVNSDISTKAKDFAKARAVAADAPDVREEKVADLKRRIASGKYDVDVDAIAERLVEEHLGSGIG